MTIILLYKCHLLDLLGSVVWGEEGNIIKYSVIQVYHDQRTDSTDPRPIMCRLSASIVGNVVLQANREMGDITGNRLHSTGVSGSCCHVSCSPTGPLQRTTSTDPILPARLTLSVEYNGVHGKLEMGDIMGNGLHFIWRRVLMLLFAVIGKWVT